ncbi:MAG: hypothetical protein II179_02840 [Alphaproteobacteria bacterium]|nr:hypothetical protein [Alphaproteobacteria bacterium]
MEKSVGTLNLLSQMYALKMLNYGTLTEILNGGQIKRQQHRYRRDLDDFYYDDKQYNTTFAIKLISAQRFFNGPVWATLHPQYRETLQSPYEETIADLLQNAYRENIISPECILDMKKFKTNILEKCALPCVLPDTGDFSSLKNLTNIELFHSLTDVDIVHLIKEQIGQVFNEPVYKNPVYQDGKIHDATILRNALEKLHYVRFTTPDEIAAAVGKDGMQLARQIRNRMFERVKK